MEDYYEDEYTRRADAAYFEMWEELDKRDRNVRQWNEALEPPQPSRCNERYEELQEVAKQIRKAKWDRLAIREAYHVLPNGHVDPHHPQGEPSATP